MRPSATTLSCCAVLLLCLGNQIKADDAPKPFVQLDVPDPRERELAARLAISPCGNLLAAFSDIGGHTENHWDSFVEMGHLRIWDVRTGQLLRPTLEFKRQGVHSLAFAADSKTVAVGLCRSLWIISTESKQDQQIGFPKEPTPASPHFEVVNTGPETLAIVRSIGRGYRWRWNSEAVPKSIWDDEQGTPLLSAIQGPTHQIVAARRGKLELMDAFSGQRSQTLRWPNGQLWNCVLSEDAKWIAGMVGRDRIALWNVNAGNSLEMFQAGLHCPAAIAFLPGNRHLLSIGEEGTLNVWDLKEKRRIRQFNLPRTVFSGLPVLIHVHHCLAVQGGIVAFQSNRSIFVWKVSQLLEDR